jgi:hypothetical protein
MHIQKFGLELRKIGDTSRLFNDVDIVLEQHGLKENIVSKDLQTQTIKHCLHKMLQPDKYLCVINIKECAKIAQIIIPRERMDIYSAVHCVQYNEMTPEYRTMIIALVIDDFRYVLGDDIETKDLQTI